MTKLFVSAIGDDGRASPTNAENAIIIVSVEASAGGGIMGLDMANFKLKTEFAHPDGSMCRINNVVNANQPGVYALYIIPYEGNTWKASVYIFSIVVTHGRDKGLALCKFMVD